MPKHYRKPNRVIGYSVSRANDVSSRGDSHSVKPPTCVWRELWFEKIGEDVLVMNASIFRSTEGLVGEHYVFYNAERLIQFDTRITDQPDRATLEGILTGKSQVILKQVGMTESEVV